jgi:membrane protein YqaA with SNARE-associated domain
MLRSLYNWTMEKAAHRHAVWWLALFAFVEASFFPIPPHPLLGLTHSFPTAACYLREYGAEIIMVKGATPIPFKLLTITAGFIHMNLVTFVAASIVSRAISFMIVGVLFRLFGAPIKRFIDKYLGLVTIGFVVLVVGGFIALTMLSGGADKTSDKCSQAVTASA